MNEYTRIVNEIDCLDKRIKALEDSVGESQTVNAVELIRLRRELCELKLRVCYVTPQGEDSSLNCKNDVPFKNDSEASFRKSVTCQPPSTAVSIPKAGADGATSSKGGASSSTSRRLLGKINEVSVGKVVLSLVAALLIILAAGIFVKDFWGTFWGQVPDTVKAWLLILAGIAVGLVGVLLYDKKRLYPYIIIYAIGSAVSYIGIVAANAVYGVFGLYLSIALILSWTVLNLLCFIKYNKITMLAVTGIGIIVSSFIMSVMAYDLARETEVYPVLYTVISLIMALMPLVVGMIPAIKKRLTDLFGPIVYGTAIVSAAVNLLYALSSISIHKWLPEDMTWYRIWPSGAIAACVTALTALALLSAVIYRINSVIKSSALRGFLTAAEIQGALLVTLLFTDNLSMKSGFPNFASPLIYLGVIFMVLVGGLFYKGAYRLVAFNLAAGLSWLVYSLISYRTDESASACLYILAAAIVYMIVLFVAPLIKKASLDRERLLSAIPSYATLFLLFAFESYQKINAYWVLLAVSVSALLVVMIFHAKREIRRKESGVYSQIYRFMYFFIDILVTVIICSMLPKYTAYVLSAVYLGYVRIFKLKEHTAVYKLGYAGLISVFSIILMFASDGAEGVLPVLLYTAASFIMIGIYASIAFSDNSNTVARVLATLFSMLMVLVYVSSMTEASAISLAAVITASAVALTAGFIKRRKSVRITSLSVLLLSVLALVTSLADFSDSFGTVTALFVSGIAVMAMGVIYSRLEKRLLSSREENVGEKSDEKGN